MSPEERRARAFRVQAMMEDGEITAALECLKNAPDNPAAWGTAARHFRAAAHACDTCEGSLVRQQPVQQPLSMANLAASCLGMPR